LKPSMVNLMPGRLGTCVRLEAPGEFLGQGGMWAWSLRICPAFSWLAVPNPGFRAWLGGFPGR